MESVSNLDRHRDAAAGQSQNYRLLIFEAQKLAREEATRLFSVHKDPRINHHRCRLQLKAQPILPNGLLNHSPQKTP